MSMYVHVHSMCLQNVHMNGIWWKIKENFSTKSSKAYNTMISQYVNHNMLFFGMLGGLIQNQ